MIVTNDILFARQFVEYYTGKYFMDCDTFEEAKKCLASECIYIKKGYTFDQIDELKNDSAYVVVQFSTEDDYTEHEYIIMFIQKKYRNRFLHNMKGNET